MSAQYLIWGPSNKVANAAVLGRLTGFDELGRLWSGEILTGEFPEDASLRMSSDFPKNTVLTDSLSSINSIIIGSTALKQFLEEQKLSHVEYHPVIVRDHKKKAIKTQYYIINPVSNIDCLDLAASRASMSRIDPLEVKSVKRLVLREDAVDASRQMFRISNFDMVTLVRKDLAAAIDKAGFTGIRWIELLDYPE
jgi:hypothetical protein